MSREALKMALEIIKATNASSQFWLVPDSNLNKAVTAIKEALAQEQDHFADAGKPMQEPVARIGMIDEDHFAEVCMKAGGDSNTPLYTAPPQREWVELTNEEIDTWPIIGHESLREFVRAIEAKLKEKNT